MNHLEKKSYKIIFLSLGFSFSFLSMIWIYNIVEWEVIKKSFLNISLFEIISLTIIYSISFFLRSLRLHLILNTFNKGSLKIAFEATCINYFLNCFLPFRLGDIARVFFLNRFLKVHIVHNLFFLSYEKCVDLIILFLFLLTIIWISDLSFNFFDFFF